MQNFIRYLLILLLQLSSITHAATPTITTHVDRQHVTEGETFKLMMTIKGEATSDVIDTKELEKDFFIISSIVSPQMSDINGVITQKTDLSLVLSPKKTGKLVIPAITIGRYASAPQNIEVSKTSSHSTHSNAKTAFLETSVDNKNPFVQSQIIYRVRLFFTTSITSGTLTEPTVENAIVIPLGDDKEYQKSIGDTEYQVHERVFAIFPQRSGPLKIEPIVFSGMKNTMNHYRNGFSHFIDSVEPLRLLSNSITLNVKPIPSHISPNEWLPSKGVTLDETWQTNQNTSPGDPITRTITLKAKGITIAQLPKIDLKNHASTQVKIYPDNPSQKNVIEDNNVIAEWHQTIAYIPTQAGTITLPELTVSWWDTSENTLKTAKLPSKIFSISGGVKPNETQTTIEQPSLINQKSVSKEVSSSNNAWPYVTLGVIIAWLCSLIYFYYSRQNKIIQPPTNSDPIMIDPKKVLQLLKNACLQQNALQAKEYLETWAKTKWPEKVPMNLGRIATEVDDESFVHELEILSAHLYSPKSTPWNGETLWHVFEEYQNRKPKKKVATPYGLQPLDPTMRR